VRTVLAFVFGLVLLPVAAVAAPSVRADLDAQRIGTDDLVQLTLTIANGDGEPDQPSLTNLEIVAGPSVSTQLSVVNGAVSQSKSYSWTLRPDGTGTGRVDRIRVQTSSGNLYTNPLSVQIVQGQLRRRQRDPFGALGQDPFDAFFGRQPRRQEPEQQGNLFIAAEPNETKVVVGQPVLVTYALYTQVSVNGIQFDEPPAFPGFWVEDLKQPDHVGNGRRVDVHGQPYQRFEIQRKLIYPTKAGRLKVPAAKLKIGIAQRSSFFDPLPATSVLDRATEPFTIDVQALPDAPGFGGAVGRFTVTGSLDRTTVPLGQAATFSFSVIGRGNLKWLDPPASVEIPHAKVYPPESKLDVHTTAAGIDGSRTWSYVVVPETGGQLEIPAVQYSYFDPELGKLVEAASTPLELQVTGAASGATGVPVQAGVVPRARSNGLRLRTELDVPSSLLPPIGGAHVAFVLALILLVHLGLWGVPKLRHRRHGSAGKATRASVRSALHDLHRASADGLSKEAAAAIIEKTLHDVFGDPGTATAGEREASELLQEVTFIRYAPQLGDYSEKIREVAQRAEAAVRRWG